MDAFFCSGRGGEHKDTRVCWQSDPNGKPIAGYRFTDEPFWAIKSSGLK
jgi:hypothetical protein